jgi:hypothetical protein
VRVRDATSGAMPDVTLDCMGLVTGWQPVGSSGNYQFTRVDLSTGNWEGQNGCDNGVNTISATLASTSEAGPAPTPFFGVTIWGWGNTITWPTDNGGTDESNPLFTRWVSYGYPAGANLTKLNDVVVSAR